MRIMVLASVHKRIREVFHCLESTSMILPMVLFIVI